MKITMNYLFLIGLFLASVFHSCGPQTKEQNVQSKTKTEEVITLAFLESLYENRENGEFLLSQLKEKSFKKLGTGISDSEEIEAIGISGTFFSEEIVAYNEPKHWIHITNFGNSSSVSLSTADKKTWDDLIKEITSIAVGKPFEDGIESDKATRYVSENYTYETYEPVEGVNLSLNNFYQIFVSKSGN